MFQSLPSDGVACSKRMVRPLLRGQICKNRDLGQLACGIPCSSTMSAVLLLFKGDDFGRTDVMVAI